VTDGPRGDAAVDPRSDAPARQRHLRALWQGLVPWLTLPVWLAVDALQPDLGFARDELRLAVDLAGVDWPGGAWLVLLSVLLAAARGALGSRPDPLTGGRDAAHRVLSWLAPVLLALTGLRLLSLWNPAGVAFPWLGMTWAPHCHLALALVPFLGKRDRSPATRRRTAAALLALWLLVYGGYTIYVCQMTMLHGDEAQYLRVTQSLLRDGDMDLANNLDGDATEFHVLNVGVDKAPAAPPGRVYSIHPVGLSVLMMPPYELGLSLWDHARLGAALAIAVCAAFVVALLYLWLCHVGIAHSLALWVTLACATTTPLFLFSTQIYPELPAVLIALVVLLRLDPRLWLPGPGDATEGSRGARHPAELFLLALAAGLTPFLHPRYAPLGLLLGAGLLWQARSQRPRMVAVVAGGLLGAVALAWHHVAFSGDILGHFKPGNAWDDNAIDPGTWWLSLPGHWLHVTKGLAVNAPWYFVAVVTGIAVFASTRDRRLLLATLLYGSTAVVNGVHPDWTFGFCLPARFVVSALPALALLAAAGVDRLRQSPWTGVLLCGALAFSLDLVAVAVRIPELAFQGEHLPRAYLAHYIPTTVFGFSHTVESMPWGDLALWGVAAAALAAVAIAHGLAHRGWRHRALPAGLVGLALLAPALWGTIGDHGSRVRYAASPRLKPVTDGAIAGTTTLHSSFRRLNYARARDARGRYAADEGSAAGPVVTWYMPIQLPGLYRILARDVEVVGDQRAYVSHQRTLPARQPWTNRSLFPVHAGDDGTYRFDYYLDRLQLGYLQFAYSGQGRLHVGATTQDYHARDLPLRLEESARFDFHGRDSPHAGRDVFEPGRYIVRYRIAGGALGTMWQHHPRPVRMAVVGGDGSDVPVERVQPWFESDRRFARVARTPDVTRPQREIITAPWWTSVPLVGDDHYEMSFLVRERSLVWFLYHYAGDADLSLEEIVVYRQHLDLETPSP
jgi:hypothetical protein